MSSADEPAPPSGGGTGSGDGFDSSGRPESGLIVRTLYAYKATYPDELDFPAGAHIRIIAKSSVDDEWWTGEHDGKVGIFPSTYVEQPKSRATVNFSRPPAPNPRASVYGLSPDDVPRADMVRSGDGMEEPLLSGYEPRGSGRARYEGCCGVDLGLGPYINSVKNWWSDTVGR
eukprot:TRINITY_DN7051_c0_g1_i1.p1 TRINITY_DN7051_c0_g1~~TRINITY_DN7051_c0_g1_i1.p1  ORF type:complete len:173 (-),score=17.27 TRINITY_DN7051_c0_g1_i1:333-851(-)